jgi:hypothetical protein
MSRVVTSREPIRCCLEWRPFFRPPSVIEGSLVTLSSSNISQVLPEFQIRLLYRLKVFELQLNSRIRLHFAVNFSPVRIELGQGESSLTQIPNLPPIPPIVPIFVEMEPSEAFDGRRIIRDLPALTVETLLYEVQVECEHSLGFRFVEFRIVKTHVNTRCKSFVEIPYTIRSKEQDTGIVLEDTKENCVTSCQHRQVTFIWEDTHLRPFRSARNLCVPLQIRIRQLHRAARCNPIGLPK